MRIPTPSECFAPGFSTVTSVTPCSFRSQRSSRLIWRVERLFASKTALSSEISETFGISANGSARPRAS